jgi:hypothetical protein
MEVWAFRELAGAGFIGSGVMAAQFMGLEHVRTKLLAQLESFEAHVGAIECGELDEPL